MPYVEREQISCPCGGEALVGWKEIDGENVPGTYCIDCGYTKIQMSDLIDHEILLPNILKDVATTLGLHLPACEEQWPGLWMIGTLNGMNFYFVTDYQDASLLKLGRSFIGRTKALFFTVNDNAAKKLANYVLGYPCAPVELVVKFDSDYNFIVDEEEWKPILDEYTPTPTERKRPAYAFLDTGEFWEITFAGKTKSFIKKRGFDYIRYLLLHPNESLFVLDLKCAVDGANPEEMAPVNDDGESADMETIQAVREQKKLFLEERNEAAKAGDQEEVVLLTTKIESCNEYLKKVEGFKKAPIRIENSRLKRLSKAVSNAIGRACDDMRPFLPECCSFLSQNLELGTQLQYQPSNEVNWVL
ncbi:MAG: hypothetical protein PHQ75_09295 [Thermoguttaceae bacterium]|nr:hypothetical protein [Thermoguttaceae bacterium]